MKKIPRLILILLIIALNIGCDQITKKMARNQIQYHETIEIIGQNLILTKVENTGAFLGVGSSLSPTLNLIILKLLPTIVMTVLLIYILRNQRLSMISLYGLSFILGGGIGNLYDRIVYGSVTDRVHIDFEIFRTGIFNMADVSVMVGMGLILLEQLLAKKTDNCPPTSK